MVASCLWCDPCCVHPQKWKPAVFLPSSVMPLFTTTLWSRAVMYPEKGTNCSNVSLKCITIWIHLILVEAMWPRINQWKSLFSWVKVWEYSSKYCDRINSGPNSGKDSACSSVDWFSLDRQWQMSQGKSFVRLWPSSHLWKLWPVPIKNLQILLQSKLNLTNLSR